MDAESKIKSINQPKKHSYSILLGPFKKPLADSLQNGLRRIIVQDIPGYAITDIALTGAKHLYQRMNHIREDLTNIAHNVKLVNLFLTPGIESYEASFQFQGPCDVYAQDLEDRNIHVLNKKQFLFYIYDDITIDFSIKIGMGTKFRSTDLVTRTNNFLPVHAVFNPVEAVFCKCLDLSNGTSDIVINVKTKGNVDIVFLLQTAFTLFYHRISYIAAAVEKEEKTFIPTRTDELKKVSLHDSISCLNLTTRANNCLTANGILTIGQLVEYTFQDLISLPRMGYKSLDKINSQLNLYDLKLSEKSNKE